MGFKKHEEDMDGESDVQETVVGSNEVEASFDEWKFAEHETTAPSENILRTNLESISMKDGEETSFWPHTQDPYILSTTPLPSPIELPDSTREVEEELLRKTREQDKQVEEEEGEAEAEEEDGRLKRPILSHFRLFGISLFWLVNNILWTAISMFLFQAEILKVADEDHKGSYLALIMGIGSGLSCFTFPIFGAMSDSNAFWFQQKWGKRKPFLFVGFLGMSFGLLGMGLFTTPELFSLYFLSYLLLKVSSDFASAPFSAIIPDVVNPKQYGIASGYWGLNSIIGSVLGGLFGLIDSWGLLWNFILLIGANILGTTVTLYFTPPDQHSIPKSVRLKILRNNGSLVGNDDFIYEDDVVKEDELLCEDTTSHLNFFQRMEKNLQDAKTFLVPWSQNLFAPLKDMNFRWVFITRFVWRAGTAIITYFLNYFFEDVVHRPFILLGFISFGDDDYEACTSVFIVLVLVGCLISSVISGAVSDRIGRKPIVIVSGIMQSLACIIFICFPSLNVGVISGFMFGLGYGAFNAVDWALAADVLPSNENNAKDLGIWQIASILPDAIAGPLAGLALDKLQIIGKRSGIPNLGYNVIYSMASILVLMGCVFIYKLKLPSLAAAKDSSLSPNENNVKEVEAVQIGGSGGTGNLS